MSDIIGAQRQPPQIGNGVSLPTINSVARLGDPSDMRSSLQFDIADPVYPTRSGPAAFFDLHQVSSGFSTIAGPVVFSLGSTEFVLDSGDSTAASFSLAPAPCGSLISVVTGSSDSSDVILVNAPEPSAASLFGIGLVALLLGRRRRSQRGRC